MTEEYPPPTLLEAYPSLELIRRAAPGWVETLERVQSDAREFGNRYIDPVALLIDSRIAEDHEYFPWDVVQRAADYGFLSLILPRMVGGSGHTSLAAAILIEEICAHCAGIGSIIGASNLGLAPLAVGGYDMHKYYLFLQDTIRGEREGRPVLWAFALTEPDSGSDMWDADEVNKASSITHARRTEDGYVLNGRKCFISNGNVARYISVYAALDKANPRDSMIALVVPNNAPGFSVVRIEHKMGQRACPAAELAFDDVFVPVTHRLGAEGAGMMQAELVSSASRGPVGAAAIGLARGALQRAWSYAAKSVIGDHRLVDEQWVRVALADMAAQIHATRQVYFASALLSDLHNPVFAPSIAGRVNPKKLMDYVARATVDSTFIKALATRPSINAAIAAYFTEKDTPITRRTKMLRSAYASAAKILGSDVAMSVTARCIEIAGSDGTRQELGLEKCFRDAKVTQIYEGTNQINRLNLFKQTARLGNENTKGEYDA